MHDGDHHMGDNDTHTSHNHSDHDHSNRSDDHNVMEPGMHTMHNMSPYLFTNKTDFYVLFQDAFIQSDAAFVAALIVSFVFASFATFLAQLIRFQEVKALSSSNILNSLISAMLFGFRIFLHYVAMLIVMTMNVWLIIAVVVGHVLGWFLFSVILGRRISTQQALSMDKACCDE